MIGISRQLCPRMLFFVTTAYHSYTVSPLVSTACGGRGAAVSSVSYDELFAAPTLPGGTYVFTDIERLPAYELTLAAEIYQAMAGRPNTFRPLNDPARVRARYALLRALRRTGINAFDVYRADDQPRPVRFPVFVRSEWNHETALTDLLPDQSALDAELDALEARAVPLSGVLVIEYHGQPVQPGVFRRFTAFRIGDAVLLDKPVTEDRWIVKYGVADLATEAMYRDDDDMVRSNRYADVLMRAFELARIVWGRVDFGLVDGRPQIYEINTNPNVPHPEPHASTTRMATWQFSWERLTQHIAAAAHRPDPPDAELALPRMALHRSRGDLPRLGWRP